MDASEQKRKEVLHRLARLEGQLRGIRNMVDTGAECEAVVTQLSAAHAAMEGVTKLVVAGFFQQCLAESLARGDDAEGAMDRVIALLLKTRM